MSLSHNIIYRAPPNELKTNNEGLPSGDHTVLILEYKLFEPRHELKHN